MEIVGVDNFDLNLSSFILINEQISPSTYGLRAQAVYDLAEITNNNNKI